MSMVVNARSIASGQPNSSGQCTAQSNGPLRPLAIVSLSVTAFICPMDTCRRLQSRAQHSTACHACCDTAQHPAQNMASTTGAYRLQHTTIKRSAKGALGHTALTTALHEVNITMCELLGTCQHARTPSLLTRVSHLL
jgi:hypothetical protein